VRHSTPSSTSTENGTEVLSVAVRGVPSSSPEVLDNPRTGLKLSLGCELVNGEDRLFIGRGAAELHMEFRVDAGEGIGRIHGIAGPDPDHKGGPSPRA